MPIFVLPGARQGFMLTGKATKKLQDWEETPQMNQDEVDQVLSALRILMKQVTSPVVRECLEAARSDIALLAGSADDLGDGSDADDFGDEDSDDFGDEDEFDGEEE